MGNCCCSNNCNDVNIPLSSTTPTTPTNQNNPINTANSDDLIEFILSNNNDEYPLPNDKKLNEIDPLELPHYLNRQIWNANFTSPIHMSLSNKRFHVLDFGCGKGTWILDMATKYPNSNFIGIDKSLIYPPRDRIKQMNVTFLYLKSLEDKLTFDKNAFHFVHLRYLNLDLPKANWTILINKLLKVLKKPSDGDDGYIEICEWDLVTFNSGPITKTLFKFGIEPIISETLEQILREKTDHLTDITVQKKYFPIGSWPRRLKRIGNLKLKELLKLLNNLKPHLLNCMGINDKEFDDMIKSFIKEVDIHKTFGQEIRIYARKT
nr:13369_t:CDS:2 [Entrophospora candida]